MSRKRGKNKPSKSKAKAETAAVPEEVLAEGSGPNETVEVDAQALADAASEALPPLADVEIKEKKTRLTTDAWGQPIEVEDEPEPEPEAELAAEIEEEAVAETQAEEQQFEEAVLAAEAEAVDAVAPEVPHELAAVEAEASTDEDELGAALPTTAATMDDAQLKNLVEALVFAADKPVTVQRLRQLSRVSDVKRLEAALEQLAVDYAPRGIALQQVSGGYQFRTNTQYSVWVQQLIAGRPVRLSRAQLETLAIVAYRQPITRPEVDDIRGVDSSATLRLLLDRSLIRVLGKKEDVGRPTLYGTTKEFLDFFSLSDLRELPTLREYSELTAESRKVMSDRLGIEADAIPSATDGDDFETDEEMAPPVDQAAEDAAAVAAVAAVTDVYGIEGQDSTADASSMDDVEASSDEQVEASTRTNDSEYARDASAATDEAPGEELAASEAPSEELAASDDLASDDLASDDVSSEVVTASDDLASDEAPSEELAASDDLASGDAPSDVLAARDDLATDDAGDVGMPRGAAQRDIVGRSTDLDEDPVLRAAAEAELDAAAARAVGDDDDTVRGSESLADDESSTDGLDMGGAEGESMSADAVKAAEAADSAASAESSESDETGGSDGL